MKIQTCLLLIVAMLFSAVTPVKAQVAFPVKISNDKRYLVDQNNKPFPILGRTAWFIVSQPDNGYKKILDNTLSHGYNSIELSVITHWAMGLPCAAKAINFRKPFTKQNLNL